jgi:hypothetical protein
MEFDILLHKMIHLLDIHSDFVGGVDDRKNAFGYAFLFGTSLILWASK